MKNLITFLSLTFCLFAFASAQKINFESLEVNYGKIFDYLRKKNFQGVLGMEHGNYYPGKEGEQKLIDAYRKSDQAYL